MLSKEEIESMKIGLWNIRADILKAMQCSLADTSDKKEWQKEINTIDNALKYIDQLESDKQKLIEKLEEEKFKIESTYSQINGNYFMAQDRLDLIQEISSILKGETNG